MTWRVVAMILLPATWVACAAGPRPAPPTEMPPPYVGHKQEPPETLYTRQLKQRLDAPGSAPVLSEEEEKRRRNEDIERTVEELY